MKNSFKETKQMLAEQERLAKEHLGESSRLVVDYQSQLEREFGYPIVYQSLGRNGAAGTARSVWDQNSACQHHSIDLAPDYPWLEPAHRAHELMHIELECRAHAAGIRKSHVAKLSSRTSPIAGLEFQEYGELFSHGYNVPVDMVVDRTVMERWPVLRPAMFLSAFRFQTANRKSPVSRLLCSPKFFDSIRALRAASALFTDCSYGNPSNFFRTYRHFPEGKLGQRLYERFTSSYPLKESDGHYKLADAFAEALGLPELHQWHAQTRSELINSHSGEIAGDSSKSVPSSAAHSIGE